MGFIGFKSVIYDGDTYVGDVEVFPVKNQKFQFPNNEIRIKYFTPSSERCPPLSILQIISPFAIRFKLQSKALTEQSLLYRLHASCFRELKTAVVLLGDEELHLVAMPTKQEMLTCFWCCSVPLGLYMSCLRMLNLRCLAIVFDLDETLIVANTMKSFEDKIEALQHRLACETDPFRISVMSAELKRYIEDKALLKQYTEGDYVMDNGKLFKVQLEDVPLLSNNSEHVIRPVIRLQERNVVLTRINPEIRDTSVLVRLRPAWEDLKSYLTARGRKRFEVFVCTMAERDYALEMWRLLDPEAHLISSKQLLERVVCVKSGLRKSLLNVFQNGICHPKMAMVIDDRQKVWEDIDQPRVHVVPAFTPYYAPQAETAKAVPVLCVARNVACNVRGGFFKEFDENLLRRIFELYYEDDALNLPNPPDVGSYLMSEDTGFVPNGNRDAPIYEGINGAEVERRISQPDEKYTLDSASGFISSNSELRPEMSQLPVTILLNIINPATARPILPSQSIVTVYLFEMQFTEYMVKICGITALVIYYLFNQGFLPSISTINTATWNLYSPLNLTWVQASLGNERQKQNLPQSKQSSFSEDDENHVSTNSRDVQSEGGKVISLLSSISTEVLQEIGRRCGSKVEFRYVVSINKDQPFFVEVLFAGEKIGIGMGKTKKEAQQKASEDALHNLADEYKDDAAPDSGSVDEDLDKLSLRNENGFLWEFMESGLEELHTEALPCASTSEVWLEHEKFPDDGNIEYTFWSGGLSFYGSLVGSRCKRWKKWPKHLPITHFHCNEIIVSCVDILEIVVPQAAEDVDGSSRSVISNQAQKRLNSPRSSQTIQTKRSKELLHGLQGHFQSEGTQ
ncbi:RNA polymerase II C-terminal domain phosphatase-like 2 [Telopea speciosissima]|uniref:RNA polymerase II C-terminal domain phosphatase-like 2 n=1 Tax=Telopea speciosissima TaxID=54955 RepID=UPI001CC3A75F|nr:RNA polymerase II C-terminal domain phosphatase-like 2 [Telopea speciosissima]